MTIEELEDKHRDIEIKYFDSTANSYPYNTKLSIEFAISVLEEFTIQYCECGRIDDNAEIESKIQELKQYLNE